MKVKKEKQRGIGNLQNAPHLCLLRLAEQGTALCRGIGCASSEQTTGGPLLLLLRASKK